jgi:hypothetical protein
LTLACAIGAASLAAQVQQGTAQRAQPIKREEVPERKVVAPLPPRGTYKPARTPWGDPDIAGPYNNSDESGIPFERPDEFAGRRMEDITPAEFAKLVKQRQEQTIERTPGLSEFPGATSPMHWFENYYAANSRPWLVMEPADGKVPPQTAEAQQRTRARQQARAGRGPADSWEDRSLYDRCITRGIPGSMMPAIYGNSYHIQQGPGFITITYEMVHDTRVIPLDGRPHLPGSVRQYMGDGRGRWEGNTLVVETTNFTDATQFRGSSSALKVTERFIMIDRDTIQYRFTVQDPATWARPWSAEIPMIRTEDPIYEYACHEGNYGLPNILRAQRVADAAARK